MCALALLAGCERVDQLWSSAREAVGQGEDEGASAPAAGPTEAEAEAEAQAAKMKQEQALRAAEQQARERLAAEQRRAKLEAGDALVASWAERLAAQTGDSGAYLAHEGLTDDDPWGKQLRVHYSSADADLQTLEVRSAGPNGVFDDDDDLLRTRETAVERSWWARNHPYLPWAALWLAVGLASAIGMHRRIRSLIGKKADAPLGVWDFIVGALCIALAPLTLAVWLLIFLANLFGFVGDVVDILD